MNELALPNTEPTIIFFFIYLNIVNEYKQSVLSATNSRGDAKHSLALAKTTNP